MREYSGDICFICLESQTLAKNQSSSKVFFIINTTAKANDTTDICHLSVVSFALAVVFIIRLFSTSAFRVPKSFLLRNEAIDTV